MPSWIKYIREELAIRLNRENKKKAAKSGGTHNTLDLFQSHEARSEDVESISNKAPFNCTPLEQHQVNKFKLIFYLIFWI